MTLDFTKWAAENVRPMGATGSYLDVMGGDYRINLSLPVFAPDGGIIGGGSENPTIRAIDRRNSDGSYSALNTGDAESTRYIGQGLLDTRLEHALKDYQNTDDQIDDFLALTFQRDPLESAFRLGALNDRGTQSTGSGDPQAFASENYWRGVLGANYGNINDTTAFDDSGAVSELLGLRTDENKSVSAWWGNFMSADAQSKRDDSGNDFLSNLIKAAAIAAAAYGGWTFFGGESALAAGAAETATGSAGLAMGADAVVGIPAWDAAYAGALSGVSLSGVANTVKSGMNLYSTAQKLTAGSAPNSAPFSSSLNPLFFTGAKSMQANEQPTAQTLTPPTAENKTDITPVIIVAAIIAVFFLMKDKA